MMYIYTRTVCVREDKRPALCLYAYAKILARGRRVEKTIGNSFPTRRSRSFIPVKSVPGPLGLLAPAVAFNESTRAQSRDRCRLNGHAPHSIARK